MPKNILLIKFAAIGDILKATPAFRAVRAHDPEARITLLVGEWSVPVVQNNPAIDHLEVFPDQDFFGRNPRGVFQAWEKLKKTEWDTIVIMHRALSWVLLARLLPAKKRIGFDNRLNRIFLDHAVAESVGTHHVQRYLALVEAIGASPQGTNMDFALTDTDRLFADRLWTENHLNARHPIIAIAPGGAENPRMKKYHKRYPLSHYRMVISELSGNDRIGFVLVGSQSDAPLAHELQANLKGSIVNLCGDTTLPQLAAVLEKCQLLLTHDTGALHIAAAVGTPTLSLFGPTLPSEHAPLGPSHHFIQSPLATHLTRVDREGFVVGSENLALMEAIDPHVVIQFIIASITTRLLP